MILFPSVTWKICSVLFCSVLLIVSQHIMSRHITSRHIAVRNKTSSSICCQCSEWLLAHALQQEIAVQLQHTTCTQRHDLFCHAGHSTPGLPLSTRHPLQLYTCNLSPRSFRTSIPHTGTHLHTYMNIEYTYIRPLTPTVTNSIIFPFTDSTALHYQLH